jgi:2-amino-4-hydroxy-6-hydroxymethyldihydropteridine diphosphokinase
MRKAYIGMGGNLASWAGTPEATLTAAAQRLKSLGRVVSRSSLYSTAPVGFAEQPRFVNAVIALQTELAPRELLKGLMAIEQEFDRDRSAGIANGPRTLDLDLLLLDNLRIREPDLEIPHPRLAKRAFVLMPLSEIAPQTIIPGCKKTVAQLMAYLRSNEISCPSGKNASEAVIRIENAAWTPLTLSESQLRESSDEGVSHTEHSLGS